MRILSVKGRPAAQLLAGRATREAARERWALPPRVPEQLSRHAGAPPSGSWPGAWWRAGEWKGRARTAPVPVALEAGWRASSGWTSATRSCGTSRACRRLAGRGLRDVDWARFEPNFFVVFPEGPLDDAPQTFVALARIDDPGRRRGSSARWWRPTRTCPPSTSPRCSRRWRAILDRVALAIRFMALFSLAAGTVVLVGAVAASRYQRVREGALLRTLGATRPSSCASCSPSTRAWASWPRPPRCCSWPPRRCALVRLPSTPASRCPCRAPGRGGLGRRPDHRRRALRQHRGLPPPAPRGAARGVTSDRSDTRSLTSVRGGA